MLILKCFVLVDLKTTKVSYEDVGQMDMYLKLFDTYKRTEGDIDFNMRWIASL